MQENWHPNQFLSSLENELGEKLALSAEVIKTNCKAEAPVKTGKLKGDIDVISVDKDTLEAKIGNSDSVPYAIHVELGTRRMSPRAYLRRGFQNSIDAIVAIFTS